MLLAAIAELALYMIERLTHGSAFRLADVGLYQEIYDGGSLPWRIRSRWRRSCSCWSRCASSPGGRPEPRVGVRCGWPADR